MTEQLRLFIAINISENIKKNLKIFLDELSTLPVKIKWVELENLHITLKFLGNVNSCDIRPIIEKLKISAAEVKSFETTCQGLEFSPKLKHPKVLWVCLKDTLNNFIVFHRKIDNNLSLLGYNKEQRMFKPHLTLGRIKSLKNISLLIKHTEKWKEKSFGSLEIKNISLMQSILKPTGPIYNELRTIDLK